MQARQKPQPRLRDMWEILKTGVPSAVQGAVFCFANIFVQASVNGFGEVAIAGSTVAMNFEYFTYYVITAFGQTATTFTGQNHAAGQKERCRKILRLCLLLSSSRFDWVVVIDEELESGIGFLIADSKTVKDFNAHYANELRDTNDMISFYFRDLLRNQHSIRDMVKFLSLLHTPSE